MKNSKNIFILLFTLIVFKISFAQTLEGKIVYQATLNTELYVSQLMFDSELSEKIKGYKIQSALNAIPMNFFLYFKGNESFYHAEFDLNEKRDMGLGMNLLGMVADDDYIYYTNQKTKENYLQSFWMDNVIINLKPLLWELTKEKKNIGEYTCYKATAILKEESVKGGFLHDPITAWYTTQIPVGFGVKNYGGLPGLTLELTQYTERGIVFYKATKIELNPKEDIFIKKPKGKEITYKEYIELNKR